MNFLFEIAFNGDSLRVNIRNCQCFFDRGGLARDEAGSKIKCLLAELDAGLTGASNKREVVFGARNDAHLQLVVFQLAFLLRQV
jgi:hypothetical protein